ncbi:MAG TPA: hypothetical protein VG267_20540 [Terracidiphilus sp.]|jgi:hypothetical protein|nr:hypothetical protein [Terracidiphilus sp.]
MKTNHMNTEELVEMYYREAAPGQSERTRLHLDECAECAESFRNLETDLKALGALEAPERDPGYGERMWQRVAVSLPAAGFRPEARQRRRFASLWMGLSYAAGCAVLAVAAFYGGMVWEHQQHLKRLEAREAQQKPALPLQPRVVVVVLGDHLDRSERLLVELKHADAENADLVKPLREEARGLLAANHEFRDDAEKSGDEGLAQALDKLDRLLTEIANEPGALNAASLERVQREMTSEGLLFEVRVLRSKNPHRETAVRVVANGGTA